MHHRHKVLCQWCNVQTIYTSKKQVARLPEKETTCRKICYLYSKCRKLTCTYVKIGSLTSLNGYKFGNEETEELYLLVPQKLFYER